MKRILAIAALLLAPALHAQTTLITAASIVGGDGNPIATGKIVMQPTDINGNPLNVNLGSTHGLMLPRAITCLIASGAITTTLSGNSCTVVSIAVTNPSNFCYRTTITDTVTSWTAPVIPCLQPSGSTYDLDLYVPSSPTALVVAGPTGPTGPVGPVGPDISGVSSDGSSGITVTGGVSAGTEMKVGGSDVVIAAIYPYTDLCAAAQNYYDNMPAAGGTLTIAVSGNCAAPFNLTNPNITVLCVNGATFQKVTSVTYPLGAFAGFNITADDIVDGCNVIGAAGPETIAVTHLVTGGSGQTNGTYTVTVTDSVGSILTLTQGSGQTPGTYSVSITDSAGSGSGATASVTVNASGFVVTNPIITAAGSRYTTPVLNFTAAGGTPATFSIPHGSGGSVQIVVGDVTSGVVTDTPTVYTMGSGYIAPTIIFTAAGGTAATFTAQTTGSDYGFEVSGTSATLRNVTASMNSGNGIYIVNPGSVGLDNVYTFNNGGHSSMVTTTIGGTSTAQAVYGPVVVTKSKFDATNCTASPCQAWTAHVNTAYTTLDGVSVTGSSGWTSKRKGLCNEALLANAYAVTSFLKNVDYSHDLCDDPATNVQPGGFSFSGVTEGLMCNNKVEVNTPGNNNGLLFEMAEGTVDSTLCINTSTAYGNNGYANGIAVTNSSHNKVYGNHINGFQGAAITVGTSNAGAGGSANYNDFHDDDGVANPSSMEIDGLFIQPNYAGYNTNHNTFSNEYFTSATSSYGPSYCVKIYGTDGADNNHFYMIHCLDGASPWSYSMYGTSGADTNTQVFAMYSQSASTGGTHGSGYGYVNPFAAGTTYLQPPGTAPSGHMILFGSTLGATTDGGAPPTGTAVFTYDTCTAAYCGNQSANISQTMVSSVPGSNGVQYSLKGEIDQTSVSTTGCTATTVTVVLNYTNQVTGNSFNQTIPIRLAASPTSYGGSFTANHTGSADAIGSYDWQFTAKSGTSVTLNTTYVDTGCSTAWTYSFLPVLTLDFQL